MLLFCENASSGSDFVFVLKKRKFCFSYTESVNFSRSHDKSSFLNANKVILNNAGIGGSSRLLKMSLINSQCPEITSPTSVISSGFKLR
jgi:hypothetical protein